MLSLVIVDLLLVNVTYHFVMVTFLVVQISGRSTHAFYNDITRYGFREILGTVSERRQSIDKQI